MSFPMTEKQIAICREYLEIVDLMLKDTVNALKDKDIKMDITKKAKNFILDKGTDIKFGARPLRRAIQRYLEDGLTCLTLWCNKDKKMLQTVKLGSYSYDITALFSCSCSYEVNSIFNGL